MKRVICINNDNDNLNLIIGKEYRVASVTFNPHTFEAQYYIFEDRYYDSCLFVTLDDYRDERLKELGI